MNEKQQEMESQGLITGITFGAYEYLHLGHIFLIQHAKGMCDRLIVCVSNDQYIKEKKGHLPEFSWHERVTALSSIREVDMVGIQSLEFGKKEAINFYKPDVIFVGDDWSPSSFSGEGLGVPVVYIPRTDNISSTKLRNGRK
jgi:glycerol-3-phosphate cytidylyltransferase